jgi:HEAT repeat protein
MFAPPLPRTLEAAVRDLTSENATIRASAAGDLVHHGLRSDEARARAVPLLVAALERDAAPPVRAAAAVGLGDLAAGDALPALLVAIEDADVQVRQMALNALGEIGDARAVARIARALEDERPDVRYQAIIAYVKIADEADVDVALARALDDADEAVSYIALRIAEERLDANKPLGPRASAEVTGRLGHASAHVALAAAIVLAKSADDAGDQARALLLGVVRDGRIRGALPEKEDEREAVEVAGQIDLREAIPHLERRAWGLAGLVRDTCAWHAKIALARMGHDRARAEILRDLGSPREHTRSAAIVAAGRARMTEARAFLESLRGRQVADASLVAEALDRLRA